MNVGKKRRAIHLTLENKMTKWLDSLPEEMRPKIKKDLIVTGGSIASMLLGEKVNDYDVYLKTKESVLLLAQHYVDGFIAGQIAKRGVCDKEIYVETLMDTTGRDRVRIVVRSAGVASEDGEGLNEGMDLGLNLEPEPEEPKEKAELPPFRPVFLSSNAITLSDDVQVIIRFFGDSDEIHKNFDFVHCMNYWTFSEGLVTNVDSLEALMSKTLTYRGSLYPVCSVFRAKKFIERGWSINAGQYLKMVLQISALDLTKFAVMEEQLTGVDATYFHILLDACKSKDNPEYVNLTYMSTVIQRLFG